MISKYNEDMNIPSGRVPNKGEGRKENSSIEVTGKDATHPGKQKGKIREWRSQRSHKKHINLKQEKQVHSRVCELYKDSENSKIYVLN